MGLKLYTYLFIRTDLSDIKLIISKIVLFGFHGLYDYEKKNGQDFVITLKIDYKPIYNKNKDIINLIDYTDVYLHLKNEFNKKRFNYLESLIDYLIKSFINKYENIKYIEISISKPELQIDDNKNFITVQRSFIKKWFF